MNNNKKKHRKLALKRETLVSLGDETLSGAAGGSWTATRVVRRCDPGPSVIY